MFIKILPLTIYFLSVNLLTPKGWSVNNMRAAHMKNFYRSFETESSIVSVG